MIPTHNSDSLQISFRSINKESHTHKKKNKSAFRKPQSKFSYLFISDFKVEQFECTCIRHANMWLNLEGSQNTKSLWTDKHHVSYQLTCYQVLSIEVSSYPYPIPRNFKVNVDWFHFVLRFRFLLVEEWQVHNCRISHNDTKLIARY